MPHTAGPVIAAAHSGAGDAYDRAEYDLRECQYQCQVGKSSKRYHSVRHATVNTAASAKAGSTPHSISFARGERGRLVPGAESYTGKKAALKIRSSATPVTTTQSQNRAW